MQHRSTGSKQGNDINIPRDGLLPAGTFRDTTTTTTTAAAAAAVNFSVLKLYGREGGDYGKRSFFLAAKGINYAGPNHSFRVCGRDE